MSKRILVINGNPKSNSFCAALVKSYIQGCQKKNEVHQLSLSELEFDLNLFSGYEENQLLEPDLKKFQQEILWSDHIVLMIPVWWGTQT